MKLVHPHEVPFATALEHGKYGSKRKPLGGQQLQTGLWELAPGKTSFPMHVHLVTEEAMYVISGNGKVRTPEGETPIGPGDYVSFPPGGPAHQLINDTAEPLLYLGMSVSIGADVVLYPDSNKVAASAGAWPKARRWIFREKDGADYLEGEE